MNRTLPNIRLPDDLADRIEVAARDERRSVSDWVRLVLERHLDDEDGIAACEGCRKRLPRMDMHADSEGAELCDDCWAALLAESKIERVTGGKG